MKKRAIILIIMTACCAGMFSLFYIDYKSPGSFIRLLYYELFIRDRGYIPEPSSTRGYPEGKTGFYQFDPRTILTSIDQGKADLFITTLTENPYDVDVEYDGIAWTQSDYLHVASALSQKVWNEPLNLNDWSVYSIFFSNYHCSDNFGGFDDFDITYYKTIKAGWEPIYIARHIKLTPWMGVATWAGDGEFSTDLFLGYWKNIELTKFKITAEQAVRIAEENGGKTARLNVGNDCTVYVFVSESPNRIFEKSWLVNYSLETWFSVDVNPFTGYAYIRK